MLASGAKISAKVPTEDAERKPKSGAMNDETDIAGVRVAPPVLFGLGLGLGLALSRVRLPENRAAAFARGLGAASVVAGIAIGAAAIAELKRVGTHLNPFKPTSALATGSVFHVSRNPAYVGATSMYVGIAMYARSLPAFVALPIVLALLDRLVVTYEERYLERRFGETYRAYRDAVPRWF